MMSRLVKPDYKSETCLFSNELYQIPQLRTKLKGGLFSLNVFLTFAVLNTLLL
jgi:hypothetical protein